MGYQGLGLPHARGGVSDLHGSIIADHKSSPRPWGCFLLPVACSYMIQVFPTPVGVFLSMPEITKFRVRLPHARGGVSGAQTARRAGRTSSPRPWGCFLEKDGGKTEIAVFPTPVGVFLLRHEP